MDYQNKYIKYKTKYIQLNNNNIHTGGARKKEQKKCYIDDTDKILFGNGGSSAIIVITQDKKVYKIFTLYSYEKDIKKDSQIKLLNNEVNNEIKIYQLLTNNIINKNISKHFVKYFGYNNCKDSKKLFNKCPSKYTDYLNNEKKDKLCEIYYRNYPIKKLINEYKILQIEYCDYSCADFIKDISKISEIEIEKYLDIFFFQIIYSILSVQKIYPYFIHRDLFMRNILGKREKDNNNYYTYKFNKKTYYIPQSPNRLKSKILNDLDFILKEQSPNRLKSLILNDLDFILKEQKLFFPKINDFGLTNFNTKYKSCKLYKSIYKDIYNIIFDIYNGGNLGASSLSSLNTDNEDKIIFLKKYFSNFFNVDILDNYRKNSLKNINWDWDNILDDEFLKSIEMKNPYDLMEKYFYNIFGKHNKNIS